MLVTYRLYVVKAAPTLQAGSVTSSVRATKGQQTRARLVETARELFVTKGFFGTGTEEIVAGAGVTRGALYHHFVDKQDLFRAVFDAVETDLMTRVATNAPAGRNAWEGFRYGLQAFLSAASEPEVQRIILIDGPAVLGWNRWRLEGRFARDAIEAAVRQAITQGIIREQSPAPLAHLLLAALNEAALLVANASDPDAARADVGATLDQLLNGLRA